MPKGIIVRLDPSEFIPKVADLSAEPVIVDSQLVAQLLLGLAEVYEHATEAPERGTGAEEVFEQLNERVHTAIPPRLSYRRSS